MKYAKHSKLTKLKRNFNDMKLMFYKYIWRMGKGNIFEFSVKFID